MNNQKPKIQSKSFQVREYFQNFFREVIELHEGVDKRAIIAEIRSKISMSGANAWMLMCSIVIASIGLDLNSQAVIIGAMLISPLMSPILGIGLAVGINDTNTLKKSLSHFSIAILIALVTSTIYFYLSPFDQINDQIRARTEPTFLDVMIAFFGGIAGIISNARKDISTTIPGVAIATALMPPLCVTGFGIAHGNFEVSLSSFYLFFVNTFFVALATFCIVRFMRFPYFDYLNDKQKRRNIFYLVLFSLLVSLPSFFIFWRVWRNYNSELNIESFINEVVADDKVFLDDYQYVTTDSVNTLYLKVYGTKIANFDSTYYTQKLLEHKLKNTVVEIIPTSEINLDRINKLENQVNGVEQMANKLEIVNREKAAQQKIIDNLTSHISTTRLDSAELIQFSAELKAIQPDIEKVNYAYGQVYDYDSYNDGKTTIIITWKKNTKSRAFKQKQINKFLKTKLTKEFELIQN